MKRKNLINNFYKFSVTAALQAEHDGYRCSIVLQIIIQYLLAPLAIHMDHRRLVCQAVPDVSLGEEDTIDHVEIPVHAGSVEPFKLIHLGSSLVEEIAVGHHQENKLNTQGLSWIIMYPSQWTNTKHIPLF